METREMTRLLNLHWKEFTASEEYPKKMESLNIVKLRMTAMNLKKQGVSFSRIHVMTLPEKMPKTAKEYFLAINHRLEEKKVMLIAKRQAERALEARQMLNLFHEQVMRKFPPDEYPFFMLDETHVICYYTGTVAEDFVLDTVMNYDKELDV